MCFFNTLPITNNNNNSTACIIVQSQNVYFKQLQLNISVIAGKQSCQKPSILSVSSTKSAALALILVGLLALSGTPQSTCNRQRRDLCVPASKQLSKRTEVKSGARDGRDYRYFSNVLEEEISIFLQQSNARVILKKTEKLSQSIIPGSEEGL